jgi:hypothetical protein
VALPRFAGNLCQIGGAERLGEALGTNRTLRSLELDSNRLTAKGAVALAIGLLKNHGLRKLTVRRASERGARAGARGLCPRLRACSRLPPSLVGCCHEAN